ncbi:hypothetical protein FQA39_LY07882 [Lamprigera yunnana]|nr:hypothetical protein FQA39_LY07882 [Lamprigera yunnana]
MALAVDVPFFLLLFAFGLSDSMTVHFIVYRTCYVTLGLNETECALLGTEHANATLEREVQPHVAILTTTKSLIEIFITAFLCFFLGSWSDIYGRKPVMILTLTEKQLLKTMALAVDVPFFLLLFAFGLSDSMTVHFIVYRTCYVTLGLNETECALLGTEHANATLEREVQPHVAILTTTKSLIEIFITAFLCFFLGSWSDIYGRKPVMILTLTGYVLAYAITTVVSLIHNASPWYLLFCSIPICMCGGFPSFLAVSICHLTESTSLVNRGLRMGIFEAVIVTAGLLGTSISSFAFHALGFCPVYVITTICIILSWIIVLVGVEESKIQVETEGKLRNLFRLSLIKDTIKTTFKQRENFDRAFLLTVVSMTVIFLLANTADGNIIFLYLRRKLQWTLKHYTLFISCRKMFWIGGSIIGGVLLHRCLHVEESVIILLGFLSLMANVFIQGIATKDWHMYIAGATICFGGSISPMTRSLISKIVNVEEYGKVFSFVILTETIVDLIGSPLYTYIYNHTIEELPGAFNFVTTSVYGFEVILTMKQRFNQKESWKNIKEHFNSKNINVFRDVASLRKQWSNMKMESRKKAALERQKLYQTGGGSNAQKDDPTKDYVMSIINEKTIFGVDNNFDSDAIIQESEMEVLSPIHFSETENEEPAVQNTATPEIIGDVTETPLPEVRWSARRRPKVNAPLGAVDEAKIAVLEAQKEILVQE